MNSLKKHYDVVIIGTGAGGGTLAYALRNAGRSVLMIERGDFIPQEADNWSARAVWGENKYQTKEMWQDRRGKSFRAFQHYHVGGNTKVYGAALPRFRREDFGVLEHKEGTSPAWPISYEEMELYYAQAEKLYHVHGATDEDPTDPPRSAPFPYPALGHEPHIKSFLDKLCLQGIRPVSMPIGIDLRPGGRCLFCGTCEGYPCQVLAKGDADSCCVRPALENTNVELLPQAFARRFLTDSLGERIVSVEVEHQGETKQIYGDLFVSACGAINSAALFLRSANEKHPDGLANSSGMLGRNFMGHNFTWFVPFHRKRSEQDIFQKTWSINDFYLRGPDWPYPLGNIQSGGKWPIFEQIYPRFARRFLSELSKDRYFIMGTLSEDLPDLENRVVLTSSGQIRVEYRPNNIASHKHLNRLLGQILKRAGYRFFITKNGYMNTVDKVGHQCGTLRFGKDPASSVLDPFCRTHDIENLYVVDASFFPSSGALNPTLTIIAQALRVGKHLQDQ